MFVIFARGDGGREGGREGRREKRKARERDTREKAAERAHLWVQIVDPLYRLLDVSSLDGIPYRHPVLDRLKVRLRVHPCLPCKVLSRLLVAFYDEIVHHETIQIAASVSIAMRGMWWGIIEGDCKEKGVSDWVPKE